MLKIGVFLNSTPSGGGTFQYNISILNALSTLSKNDYYVKVVFTNSCWGKYLKHYSFDNVFIEIKNHILYKFLKYVARLKLLPMNLLRKANLLFNSYCKEMIEYDLDIWIFPSQDMQSFEIPINSLTTIHDLMHRYERKFPEVGSFRTYWAREWLYKNMCNWCSGILVDSELGKEHVANSYRCSKNKIYVLPYVSFFKKNLDTENIAVAIPEKYIFYPAQFWMHKNHINLIKAVAFLRDKKNITVNVLLCGGIKNSYKSVQDIIKKLKIEDQVIIKGYVSDEELLSFYKNALALVMPTYFGPTNLPILEAFSIGCPVAVSNIYAIPAQVKDAALLFDPNNINSIAESIEKIITDNDLRKVLIKNGYQRSQEWNQNHFELKLKSIIDSMTK